MLYKTLLNFHRKALYKKCPHSEFFWSALSRIWIEDGELKSKSPFFVQMWENTDQKNFKFGPFSLTEHLQSIPGFSKATSHHV